MPTAAGGECVRLFNGWEDRPVVLGMHGTDIGIMVSLIAGGLLFGFVFTLMEGTALGRSRRATLVLELLGVVGCFAGGILASWIGQPWAVVIIPIVAFCLSVIPGIFWNEWHSGSQRLRIVVLARNRSVGGRA